MSPASKAKASASKTNAGAVAIWEAMERPEGGRGKTRSESDQVRNRAAKFLNMSHDTLSKAKQVVEAVKKDLRQNLTNLVTVGQILTNHNQESKLPRYSA
jgi:hypothetical protein